MSGHSDLVQLLNLRRLREDRARTAVSDARRRLEDALRLVAEAATRIEKHDLQAGQQEQQFLAAMGIRPVSGNEFGLSRDLLGVFEEKRSGLLRDYDQAVRAHLDCKAELARTQTEWRKRLIDHDRLAEVERGWQLQEHEQLDAAREGEEEDMSADRLRMSC